MRPRRESFTITENSKRYTCSPKSTGPGQLAAKYLVFKKKEAMYITGKLRHRLLVTGGVET